MSRGIVIERVAGGPEANDMSIFERSWEGPSWPLSREARSGITSFGNVLQMVKRRAADAGFDPDQISCHTFRATGITTYLENDGDLETAQHIAGHASANTTRIYDHRDQKVEQEEIERVRI